MHPLPPEKRLPRIFIELGYRAIAKNILCLRRVAEMLRISDLELEDRLYGGNTGESDEEVYV